MTNHPNRKIRAAMIVENGYATIVLPGGRKIETCCLGRGRYVRIDDGPRPGRYPQLCYGAATYGNTLIYTDDEKLARNCGARLYKTREKFDEAAAKLAALDPIEID